MKRGGCLVERDMLRESSIYLSSATPTNYPLLYVKK